MDRFKRDMRMKDYLMSNSFDEDFEMPRLHRKNEKWESPKAIGPLEDCLKKFETSVHQETST